MIKLLFQIETRDAGSSGPFVARHGRTKTLKASKDVVMTHVKRRYPNATEWRVRSLWDDEIVFEIVG